MFCIAVLLAVFHYLDDISLWQATKVCIRWQNILNAELCEDQWKTFIDRRWPLFQPQYSVTCWKVVYSKMYVHVYCFVYDEVFSNAPVIGIRSSVVSTWNSLGFQLFIHFLFLCSEVV